MTVVKAKGIPQHVVDKLELPALPDGWWWKLRKYKANDGLLVLHNVYIKKRMLGMPKTVISAWVFPRENRSLVTAYRDAANDLMVKIKASVEAEKLWEK